MSDLVERLRAVGQDYDFHDNALVYEAADEIERLRAENFRLAAITCDTPTMDEWGNRGCSRIASLRQAIWTVERQLNIIRDDLITDRESDDLVGWASRVEEAAVIARAALGDPMGALGYVLVPRKPTNAMLKAAAKSMSPEKRPTKKWVSCSEKHAIRYRAMIAAALEDK